MCDPSAIEEIALKLGAIKDALVDVGMMTVGMESDGRLCPGTGDVLVSAIAPAAGTIEYVRTTVLVGEELFRRKEI